MLLERSSRAFLFSLLALTSPSSALEIDSAADTAITTYRQDYYRICPLPKCAGCLTSEQIHAPGIGFALEMSYGTAVVKLHNGSHHRIALVSGDSSYKELLGRLATGPMDRTPDHFDSAWEKWQYVQQRARRHLNKLRGLPATPDTAILAAMVSALQNATQSWLGSERPINRAVISCPDRVRLTDEEMNDVFDYLKLKNLLAPAGPNWHEELYSASAAYAGYGKGLCSDYTDAYRCEEEEWYFPYQRLLHTDHTRESMSATIKGLSTARDGAMDAAFIDLSLGTDNIRWQDDHDGSQYTQAITNRIRELVMSYRPKITALLLTGTEASNLGSRVAVRDALRNHVTSEQVLEVLIEGSDLARSQSTYERQQFFEFATARGAAEIAKRRQEGPIDCVETEECQQRRRHKQLGLLRGQDKKAKHGL